MLDGEVTELTNEAIERLEAIEGLTKSSVEADPSMWKEIRALQLRLIDVQEIFAGDPTRTKRNDMKSRGRNSMEPSWSATSSLGPTSRRCSVDWTPSERLGPQAERSPTGVKGCLALKLVDYFAARSCTQGFPQTAVDLVRNRADRSVEQK